MSAPADYEAWYATPRGQWISRIEFALLASTLRAGSDAARARPAPAPIPPPTGAMTASLLDVGCGTGHFTRLFAASVPGVAIGADPNVSWLRYAAARAGARERYVAARAEALPFPDRAFDHSICVTALCFAHDQRGALRELLRVTRRRFALGLLNRASLLYLTKGRGSGRGGYRGARWHTPAEVRALFAGLPVANLALQSAVVLPGGSPIARALEQRWPRSWLLGGFLVVGGDVR